MFHIDYIFLLYYIVRFSKCENIKSSKLILNSSKNSCSLHIYCENKPVQSIADRLIKNTTTLRITDLIFLAMCRYRENHKLLFSLGSPPAVTYYHP